MKEPRTSPGPVQWDGSIYHRVSEPQFEWGRKVLARLPLAGHETVMDAGCGTGRLTALLLERLPRGRVIAVDQSASMLRTAREFLQPRYAGRVEFHEADLAALEFDRACDAIFSTATIHWVRDQENLFARFFRALRPGGRLVAQGGGEGNVARIRERAMALVAAPDLGPDFAGWVEPWNFFPPDVTARRLSAAGFIEIETSLEPAPARFPDADSFRTFLANVVLQSMLARIPDEARRGRFLEGLVRQASEDRPPFELDYVRLNLSARRPGA